MNLFNYIKTSEKLLNQMPGSILVVDQKYNIVWANDKASDELGFKSPFNIYGKRYADFNCKASENAEIYESNDCWVFTHRKKFSFLSFLEFSDGWKLTLGEKSHLVNDEEELLGLIAYWTDITNFSLIDLSRFLVNLDAKTHGKVKKQFVYTIECENSNPYRLSQRQLECLFFLLRGKSSKEIGKILNLSPRTIESYIDEIKLKMGCSIKSQVIEKAFVEGLFNMIPESFIIKFNQN